MSFVVGTTGPRSTTTLVCGDSTPAYLTWGGGYLGVVARSHEAEPTKQWPGQLPIAKLEELALELVDSEPSKRRVEELEMVVHELVRRAGMSDLEKRVVAEEQLPTIDGAFDAIGSYSGVHVRRAVVNRGSPEPEQWRRWVDESHTTEDSDAVPSTLDGVFASFLAHELASPLHAALAMLAAAKRGKVASREALEESHRLLQRAISTLEICRWSARVESKSIEPRATSVEFRDVVFIVTEAFRSAGLRYQLIRPVPSGQIPVSLDVEIFGEIVAGITASILELGKLTCDVDIRTSVASRRIKLGFSREVVSPLVQDRRILGDLETHTVNSFRGGLWLAGELAQIVGGELRVVAETIERVSIELVIPLDLAHRV